MVSTTTSTHARARLAAAWASGSKRHELDHSKGWRHDPTNPRTDANVFNDPSSYRAFIARVYAGLAVSGQQGAAGQPDIQGIDEGFSQYLRLYWEAEELPSDEA